ncbi:phosphoenolpyruvate carboxylase, partial [Candidatus Woesearchaeota archaeon]|nr:phosphoenolpyruvate carboxylase [Candidatus Woesearchaeota archaeon]
MKKDKVNPEAAEERKIPATAATQVTDNACRPFWAFKEEAGDDFFDCYVSFKELDCQEYFWEWKSRKIDELIVRRLVDTYRQYFTKNPIGSVKHITLNAGAGEPLDT